MPGEAVSAILSSGECVWLIIRLNMHEATLPGAGGGTRRRHGGHRGRARSRHCAGTRTTFRSAALKFSPVPFAFFIVKPLGAPLAVPLDARAKREEDALAASLTQYV